MAEKLVASSGKVFPLGEVRRYPGKSSPEVERYPFYKYVPKDDVEQLKFRLYVRLRCLVDQKFREAIYEMCRQDLLFFCNTMMFVFEPRPKPRDLILNTWPDQDYVLACMDECFGVRDVGCSKSRGVGASWNIVALSYHKWEFEAARSASAGVAIGFVSRTEDAVDSRTDSDTLMWKLDYIHKMMPCWMRVCRDGKPKLSRNYDQHKFMNRETNSAIFGYAATGDVMTGGRKAQPLDAKILTPTGWTTMGQVKVGDEVIGANGRATVVTAVTPQGVRPIYRVGFQDGTSTECCDDHLWLVSERSQRQNRNPKPMKVLRLKDMLGKVKAGGSHNYHIPVVEPINFEEGEPLPVEPYLLGCLIGDGGLSGRSVKFTSADQPIVSHMYAQAPLELRLAQSGKYGYSLVGPKKKKNPLTESLQRLGLMGKKSYDKFIPKQYLFSSQYNRLEVLRGLLDTDGWICVRGKERKNCRIKFSSTSKQLVDDVQFIVQSLGGVASLCKPKTPTYTYRGEKRTGRTAYELTVNLPNGMNPFKLPRKADKYIERSTYLPRRTITSIELVGEKECQCIRVDASDSLYVTDHCIVTHNSAVFLDEFGKFGAGKDQAALDSTQYVTNCRYFISTYLNDTNAFYRLMQDKTSMLKIEIDWKDNPDRAAGLYKVHNGKIEILDKNYVFPDDYPFETDPMKGGFIRSPWYDAECRRPGATARSIAREIDRDARGASSKVFATRTIQKAETQIRTPSLRGEMQWDDETYEPNWTEQGNGKMCWWDVPISGQKVGFSGPYVIGCDVAWGTAGDYSSNSAMVVIDATKRSVVGEYVSNAITPHDFCRMVVATMKFLAGGRGEDQCYLIWENQGPGTGFWQELKRIGWSNYYTRRGDVRDKTSKFTKKAGWWNTSRELELCFNNLQDAILNDRLIIPAERAIRELSEYEFDNSGKIVHVSSERSEDGSAKSAAHGDAAIALALAFHAFNTRVKNYKNQVAKSVDGKLRQMLELDAQIERERKDSRLKSYNDFWEELVDDSMVTY